MDVAQMSTELSYSLDYSSVCQVLEQRCSLHVFMCRLHGLGSKAHVFEHFCVCVGVLQSLPLELDGGERAVDLGELLFVPLLSFQSLKSR